MKSFLYPALTAATLAATPYLQAMSSTPDDRPNILWIVSEDNSPLLGCYGDDFATTPHLDALSARSITYDNAFANAPVCAPARFTILTGMMASTMGTENMRSTYPIPEFVKPYPYYLRKAGYYCTNPGKTDYNFETDPRSHWDTGTYKDRAPGQPFFHVVNSGISHESSLHRGTKPQSHDPAKVPLPPYHPDTPVIRETWAVYYDAVEEMDAFMGSILAELEADGLAEDTIVFYYADHGGAVARSKRFLYDTGTHVPMIIHFPRKFRHLAPGDPGTRSDRIVSFVDLAPTLFSLAGIEIPEYTHGKAFLGENQAKPREYAYLFHSRMGERYDLSRAIRDKRFKYIRNYMPHRIYGLHHNYLWNAPATGSWETAHREGRTNAVQSLFWQPKPSEELYDTQADPYEVNNLAEDTRFKAVLQRMQKDLQRWIRDSRDPGFVPEGVLVDQTVNTTAYDLVRSNEFPVHRIIETAELASSRDPAAFKELQKRLRDPEPAVRFWAATGCLILGETAKPASSQLQRLLEDASGDVRVAAAEALHQLGEQQVALESLAKDLTDTNPWVALRAANVLEVLGDDARPAIPRMREADRMTEAPYVKRSPGWTLEKLGAP